MAVWPGSISAATSDCSDDDHSDYGLRALEFDRELRSCSNVEVLFGFEAGELEQSSSSIRSTSGGQCGPPGIMGRKQ